MRWWRSAPAPPWRGPPGNVLWPGIPSRGSELALSKANGQALAMTRHGRESPKATRLPVPGWENPPQTAALQRSPVQGAETIHYMSLRIGQATPLSRARARRVATVRISLDLNVGSSTRKSPGLGSARPWLPPLVTLAGCYSAAQRGAQEPRGPRVASRTAGPTHLGARRAARPSSRSPRGFPGTTGPSFAVPG